MPDLVYNWKRFWYSRGSQLNLVDGYLPNPDDEWGQFYNEGIRPFEALHLLPCLALLGEPGMGKSMTIQSEIDALQTQLREEDSEIIVLDLRSYSSDVLLVRDLFESSAFIHWNNGTHVLYLFIDSLDECLIRISSVAALLATKFANYDVKRLRLRIACRTADWPKTLEDTMLQLWGEKNVGIYELSPLRRTDVVTAAQKYGFASDAFLQEVNRVNGVPLAIKPLTLKLLLRLFQANRKLPTTQTELYLQGVTQLCNETNKNRVAAHLTGDYDVNQRFAVAARLAAFTIVGKKSSIYVGSDEGEIDDVTVPLRDTYILTESANGNEFAITRRAVQETLDTGLFSSRGLERLGWAHQTYGEFLAAYYLKQSGATVSQMMSLLVNANDPDGRVVPQLSETAAWLASMDTEVFRWLLNIDPSILLRSDVAAVNADDKAELVDRLLELYDQGGLAYDGQYKNIHFSKLNHSKLTEQLRPYLSGNAQSEDVMLIAVEIVYACKLSALQNELLTIALSASYSESLRRRAIIATSSVGELETKTQLKPLLTVSAQEDPNENLKGEALKALWPDLITAQELFSTLTWPRRDDYIGAYHMFLKADTVEGIKPIDLPDALEWVTQQPATISHNPLHGVIHAIIARAWDNLNTPGVDVVFAKAALSLANKHERIKGLSDDQDKRRRILRLMLPLLEESQESRVWIVARFCSLVSVEDTNWLIGLLEAASEKMQVILANLIRMTYAWGDLDQLSAIVGAKQQYSAVAKELPFITASVSLNSPQAQEMREEYNREQEGIEQDEDSPEERPSIMEDVEKLLQGCMVDSSTWWRLCVLLAYTVDGRSTHGEHISTLTELPIWQSADASVRSRIVSAAKRYVLEQEIDNATWIDKEITQRPVLAGYKAMRLLMQELPEFIFSLPAKIWKRWAPILVACQEYDSSNRQAQKDLVELAYTVAADEVINTVCARIDWENSKDNYIFVDQAVEMCWDQRMRTAIFAKAQDEKLKPVFMGYLLDHLLLRGDLEAQRWAEKLVSTFPYAGEVELNQAVLAAKALMYNADDAGWSTVWPAMQRDVVFANKLVAMVAGPLGHAEVLCQRLSENAIASLYRWLNAQYPEVNVLDEEELSNDGFGDISEIGNINLWRNSVFNSLVRKGTYAACEEIQALFIDYPEKKWLKYWLQEAQEHTRRNTWSPPTTADILTLTRNKRSHLVRNSSELMEVVLEALARMEQELHGETPTVRRLWDRVDKKRNLFRPKDEEDFSDEVKKFLEKELKAQGVVLGREVQIKPTQGTAPGEVTDIYISAVTKDARSIDYSNASVIIETKGCWNQKVRTAMQTQLLDRYLTNNLCTHGVYLVGWFNCDQWNDPQDGRKKDAPAWTKAEAQTFFEDMAVRLSKDGKSIKSFVMNTALRAAGKTRKNSKDNQ